MRRFNYNNDTFFSLNEDIEVKQTNEPDLCYTDCGKVFYLDGIDTGYRVNSPVTIRKI